MISKSASTTIVPLLGYHVFPLVETLQTRKWSDSDIPEDLDFIKEALGSCLVNLTQVPFSILIF